MPNVGDTIRWERPSGGVGSGTVIAVIDDHWITGRVAYEVQGNCERLVVHESQIKKGQGDVR